MTRDRIVLLDALRGLGVLGILWVNMLFFAGPIEHAFSLKGGAFTASPASAAVWWAINTLFSSKFISLFSMLFGVSSYLVGGERHDRERSRHLRRRYLCLAGFGLIHGALIWYGDVLLDYALCGALIYFVRSWPARRLIWVGAAGAVLAPIGFMVWSAGVEGGWLWAVISPGRAATVAQFQGGLLDSLSANLRTWTRNELSISAYTIPFSLPLMALGLGLYKTGFLTGAQTSGRYRVAVAVGAAALVVSGTYFALYFAPVPAPWLDKASDLVIDWTSPLIALGYASLIILAARSRWLSGVIGLLAPAGRMAFSNYIGQSLIMTAICYGGRGPDLFGQLDRPALALIAVALWIFQIVLSHLWLARFRMGPLEWLWRVGTYGHRVPLRREALAA